MLFRSHDEVFGGGAGFGLAGLGHVLRGNDAVRGLDSVGRFEDSRFTGDGGEDVVVVRNVEHRGEGCKISHSIGRTGKKYGASK